jgi:hypothetical protein
VRYLSRCAWIRVEHDRLKNGESWCLNSQRDGGEDVREKTCEVVDA